MSVETQKSAEALIIEEKLKLFELNLREEERRASTIRQYLRDARSFSVSLGNPKEMTKEQVIRYKERLGRTCRPSTANTKLAAVNHFLRVAGHPACTVRMFRVQQEAFRSPDRELTRAEYLRLLDAAKRKRRHRLHLVMQTIASTGIRVSELPFITVGAVRRRRAQVALKGKVRAVVLPRELCQALDAYIREKGIREGSVFVTRSGRCLDRSNILHEMKALCEEAQVSRNKVFPHNLRHLFAVTYYRANHDLCHLADILGHSSINTTRIYTRMSCEAQEEEIGRLGLVADGWEGQKNTA